MKIRDPLCPNGSDPSPRPGSWNEASCASAASGARCRVASKTRSASDFPAALNRRAIGQMVQRRYGGGAMFSWVLTLACLLLGTVAFTAMAADASSAFEQANSAFASGNYRAAITQYEAILGDAGYSAPVLFNLGNAEYRAGQFGAAILNYERALVLAPGDRNITANLRLAREKAGVSAPALDGIQQAARVFSPDTLAWLGSLAFLVICLSLGLQRFLPRFAYAKTLLAAAGVLLLAVGAAFAIRWPDFNRAIVVVTTAPARIAPASTAAESFALKAGEPVTAVKTYGQFVLARTPDGRSGWVSKNEVGLVFAAGFRG